MVAFKTFWTFLPMAILFMANRRLCWKIMVQIEWRAQRQLQPIYEHLKNSDPAGRFHLELEMVELIGRVLPMEIDTGHYDVATFNYANYAHLPEYAHLPAQMHGQIQWRLRVKIHGHGHGPFAGQLISESIIWSGVDRILTYSLGQRRLIEDIPYTDLGSIEKSFPQRVLKFVFPYSLPMMRLKIECRIGDQIVFQIHFPRPAGIFPKIPKAMYSFPAKVHVCPDDIYTLVYSVEHNVVETFQLDCGEAINEPNLSNVYFINLSKGPTKYTATCSPMVEEFQPNAVMPGELTEHAEKQAIYVGEEAEEKQWKEHIQAIQANGNSFQTQLGKTQANFDEFQREYNKIGYNVHHGPSSAMSIPRAPFVPKPTRFNSKGKAPFIPTPQLSVTGNNAHQTPSNANIREKQPQQLESSKLPPHHPPHHYDANPQGNFQSGIQRMMPMPTAGQPAAEPIVMMPTPASHHRRHSSPQKLPPEREITVVESSVKVGGNMAKEQQRNSFQAELGKSQVRHGPSPAMSIPPAPFVPMPTQFDTKGNALFMSPSTYYIPTPQLSGKNKALQIGSSPAARQQPLAETPQIPQMDAKGKGKVVAKRKKDLNRSLLEREAKKRKQNDDEEEKRRRL